MKQLSKKPGPNGRFGFQAWAAFFRVMFIHAKTGNSFYHGISILVISVVSGCSKKDAPTTPPENNYLSITVVEKITNKPIAGATVSLRKCSNYDFQFGCTAYATSTTLTTNAEGKVTYPRNSTVNEIKVDANKYWTVYKKTDFSNVVLVPKTSLEVNVKREKTYAATDILWIGQYRFFNDLISIGQPVDTTVYIDGYGYSDNKIYWFVNYYSGGIINTMSTGGSSPSFYVNGFDTAKIGIKY